MTSQLVYYCWFSCHDVQQALDREFETLRAWSNIDTDLLAESATGRGLAAFTPLRWLNRAGLMLELTSLQKHAK